MNLKGHGYCVGPGYESKGPMVFDIFDHDGTLLLLVCEDKEWVAGPGTTRRENAVHVSEDDLRGLSNWLQKRLGSG